ncbi:hypothetical protein KAFR_0B03640 [Kazachstania africana CBS 2517]|uniref:Glutamate decarboxylase n=1 Tax=Kazachstania africana (strain ATCC 22294 / BCRC 22015 / CBS 2517 / CECT 1963 / NBRC 1671 / NRRL Y-8276) TaxID=1071382 RepID=H2AQL1_KAZAF|nr:hypothetical protein KAFR_0B03640 [Kazachstania africana CBS 2517]CCF56661.1 hypothetical protein KAFR_0B03640 [Kazachstania africana CBS 2517]
MLHRHSAKHRNPRTVFTHKKSDLPPESKLLSYQEQELEKGKLSGVESVDDARPTLANKYKIPKQGIEEKYAYQLVHNELTLDGNPHLNLASFVNTYSTDEAKRLITENLNKNLADNDEYPQLIEITQRCISILSQLWHCDENMEPMGCSTTGSSEAIMLGGLAMKKNWVKKMEKAGKPIDKPNIVMSCACQVALEKFARYFDVECRLVPVSAKSHHMLDPSLLHEYVDENTIGLFVIMGTTYTGHLEDVEDVSNTLTKLEKEHPEWSNTQIPIHVDGASGGFIVPFAFENSHMKEFGLERWAFNNPRVVSINTSSHKFGLTTPGLGWVLWKDEAYLPQELRFRLKYLGGVEETFGLNFSRPGFQVVHQYFNFISKGAAGYRETFRRSLFVARVFSHGLLTSNKLKGCFDIVSSIHEKITDSSTPKGVNEYWESPSLFKPGVPLVAFKLTKEFQAEYSEIPQVLISSMLRARGWIIPNYPLPKSTDESDKDEVLRVVFRHEMKLDLAQLLLFDIEMVMQRLVNSYRRVCMHVDKKLTESDESKGLRRSFIYDMLLTLASPEGEEISEGDLNAKEDELNKKHKKKQEIRERTSRNYRGTC